MTINTSAAIVEKQAEHTAINAAASIANGAYSTEAQTTALVLTDKVRFADAVLDITLPTLATAGKSVHLYRRDKNIKGSNHAPVPGDNFPHIYIGSFPLNAVGTQQFISLPGIAISDDCEFYIKNDSGLATSGTTVLTLTPWTWNGKA